MSPDHRHFDSFYRALYGYEPFPWQRMLAELVVEGEWPECLDLPTGSGKTACLDIAVFAMACQADRAPSERTAPRRVFFVVDRRIVVDAAHERAARLATQLREAREGVLHEVADRLRSLADGTSPLVVGRMRGGVARDDSWVRSPIQPAVVTGTVDQVGSRMLFRAYGGGLLAAPVHAALVANDSLIILDEAHCAVPFFQTAKAVERYRAADWAERPISSPFRVVVMSATPPGGVSRVFPSSGERRAALGHAVLTQRVGASKRAELAVARRPAVRGLHAQPGVDDALVLEAAHRAIGFATQGSGRIAVMVNRVSAARAIHRRLRTEAALEDDPLPVDALLLTGRMRPLDRDDLVAQWVDRLRAQESQPELGRPVIVVTTQCLEVGADFSFDALVTECASLDALRQRFGRLNRFGTGPAPRACVLVRAGDVKTEDQLAKLDAERKAADPIYGNSLARTWNWLSAEAEEGPGGVRNFDFGIRAVDALLPARAEERQVLLAQLSAPSPDAPVLLPAHLDCWAQTSPRPKPDPDVSVFLHGPARGEPEVYVVLRADLDLGQRDRWIETVSLAPPATVEAFPIPMRLARAWLAGEDGADAGGDVEGAAVGQEETAPMGRRAVVLWRGRDASVVTLDPFALHPGDVMVVPAAATEVDLLGDIPANSDGDAPRDVGDRALIEVRDRPILRIHAAVLGRAARHPAVGTLLRWAEADNREEDEGDLEALLLRLGDAGGAALPDGTTVAAPPDWMRRAARALAFRREVAQHPSGGYVLTSRLRLGRVEHPEVDAFADDDDTTSGAPGVVPLRRHLQAVESLARQFARQCLPAEEAGAVVGAAALHDLGKADWRFQVMLHGGNEIAALRRAELLAKSDGVPSSSAARRRARALSGLPGGFRHEMLSAQLVAHAPALAHDTDRELLLHLIASHHGHGRPFAPVVKDDEPPEVDLTESGFTATLSAADRRRLAPPHRLDSGVAERFWRLSRRYGWWGIAYLEAMLRLADWHVSEQEARALSEAVQSGTAEAA